VPGEPAKNAPGYGAYWLADQDYVRNQNKHEHATTACVFAPATWPVNAASRAVVAIM
jgi:hypothetical protein